MTSTTVTQNSPVVAASAVERALLDELVEHRSQLADLQAIVEDLTGQADSDSMLEREMAERAIPRGLDVIADIERALRVLSDGTYGICEQCGDAIAPARLEAIPYVRHCVSCPPPPPS